MATKQLLSGFPVTRHLAAYFELTKPGITFMVLTSMLVGFILGSAGSYNFLVMIHAIVGTFLIASGTAAHNQFIERNLDKLMNRTSGRPIPSERIAPEHASAFSLILIFAGLFYLIFMVNTVAGIVSAVTTFMYLAIYTPMKRRTFLNVIIGSVPGALPPVGGWAAATGSIGDVGVWLLFGVVFLWQIPHVLAIAWVCNDDYINAGFQMLPANDKSGKKTGLLSLFCLFVLIPNIILIYSYDIAGVVYLVVSIIATLLYLFYGVRFYLSPDQKFARKLMFASFFYLPVIWVMIFTDLILSRFI